MCLITRWYRLRKQSPISSDARQTYRDSIRWPSQYSNEHLIMSEFKIALGSIEWRTDWWVLNSEVLCIEYSVDPLYPRLHVLYADRSMNNVVFRRDSCRRYHGIRPPRRETTIYHYQPRIRDPILLSRGWNSIQNPKECFNKVCPETIDSFHSRLENQTFGWLLIPLQHAEFALFLQEFMIITILSMAVKHRYEQPRKVVLFTHGL